MLVQAIQYRHADGDNPGDGDRLIDVFVNDGFADSAPAQTTINVNPVNDAPSWTGNGTLASIAEDNTNPPGATIVNLLGGQYSDIDLDTFDGVAVIGNTANPVNEGAWQYSTDGGGNWFDVGAVGDDATALALSTGTLLRFVPVTDYNGSPPTLVTRALDATYGGSYTNGAARINVDTTTNGGATAISGNTANVNTTVDPANDAPALTSFAGPIDTTNEDTEVEVTFAELAAQGNEADVDGTVDAFVVKSVATGVLKIGADAGSATAFAVGTNDTINAALSAYWTPDLHVTGAQNAFQVVAGDDQGAESTPNVTAQINVTAANDPPAFSGLDNAPAFNEGGPAVVLDNNATISDPELDVANDYSGATLTLVRSGGANADDLFDGGGALNPLVESGSLVVNATSIGTVTTNSGGVLVLTFNSNATTALVNSALQQITYANASANPPAGVQIAFTMDDGNAGSQGSGGALSDTGSIIVTINPANDPPVLANLAGDTLLYAEGSGALVIEQGGDALVNDVDSTDFAGGQLRISIAAGGVITEGVLSIRNQGVNSGEIGFSSGNVTYGGVSIGSALGGVSGTDLVINLNGSATPAAVAALVNNITYENLDLLTATAGIRTARFTLDDGDGGVSLMHDAFVNVFSNDLPVITSPATAMINENNSVALALKATDVDSPGVTFAITGGVDQGPFFINGSNELEFFTPPDFEAPSDNNSDNVYHVQVTADDGDGGTASQLITVTVNGVNDHVPVWTSPSATPVLENTFTVVHLSATDADLPATAISFTIVGGADAAQFTIAGADTLVFATAPNFENPADADSDNVYEVDILADDGDGSSTLQTVSVSVVDANETPVSADDLYSVERDQTLRVGALGVLGGDTDEDGQPLTAVLVSGPTHGVLTMNADGSFTYTPDPGYRGADRFTYRANDGSLMGNEATVTIDVLATAGPRADIRSADTAPRVDNDARGDVEPPKEETIEAAGSFSVEAKPQAPLIFSLPKTNRAAHQETSRQLSAPLYIAVAPSPSVTFDFDTAPNWRQSSPIPRTVRTVAPAVVESLERFMTPFDVQLLWNDLSQMKDELHETPVDPKIFAGAAVGFSSVVTAGYVIWTVRGGWLVTSLLAQMPAWRLIDPLVVLDSLSGDPARKDDENQDDEDDEDSLESMLEESPENTHDTELEESTTEK